MNILVVTPRFPYPESGACEQDRAEGFRQLKRLGHEVAVLGKYFDWQDAKEIEAFWKKENIPVTLVPYRYKGATWKKLLSAFLNPLYLDGAAAEFRDPVFAATLREMLEREKRSLVWFDYTYLWPLYGEIKKRKIPIIVRSINVESRHFLDEDGRSFVNYLKFVPKYFSEIMTARRADVVFAITPKEEAWYRAHGARTVHTLPLRALPKKLFTDSPRPREAGSLHVFFSGSTYTVAHNRRALEFIVKELAPAMFKMHGMAYAFHITGAKLPKDFEPYIRDNVAYEGFVDDMETFLHGMDIAVVPSFFGCGMQQKIFEPLARGFPTITHERGIAGYGFVAGEEYLRAEALDDYVKALLDLRSIDKRRHLSENCKKKSRILFNQETIDGIVRNALGSI